MIRNDHGRSYNTNYPKFSVRTVPIAESVKAIGKDAEYICIGI